MIEQYPDTLTYTAPEGVVSLKCRFVPNLRNATIRRPTDGTEVVFTFNIAFPLGSPSMPSGAIIDGVDKDGYTLVDQQPLIQWHSGQLHNRGWV